MSQFLSHLEKSRGTRKRKKRLGRGDSSGHGGTSTRGHKGQRARSGGYHKLGFEGGQMPLTRRVPKHGFTNIFRKEFVIVNVGDLSQFQAGSVIEPHVLQECGLIDPRDNQIKILGEGELTIPLTVRAHRFSKSAAEKIQKVGGKVEPIQEKVGRA